MIRTNIYFSDTQRKAMTRIAKRRKTKPAQQYRDAVDAHIEKYLPKEKQP